MDIREILKRSVTSITEKGGKTNSATTDFCEANNN